MASGAARAVLVLSLLTALAGCCLFAQQSRGGLEGLTRDTPRQAFAYFQEAARIGRYDLEFECFSEEFKEKHGGFTQDEYLIGRPHVSGDTAKLLRALLAAKVVGEPEIIRPGVARLRLEAPSEGYRGEILVIQEPYGRLGLEGYDRPVEIPLESLRGHVRVQGETILAGFPLTEDDRIILDLPEMPDETRITRVEVASRWSLLDIGAVFEVDTKDSQNEERTP